MPLLRIILTAALRGFGWRLGADAARKIERIL